MRILYRGICEYTDTQGLGFRVRVKVESCSFLVWSLLGGTAGLHATRWPLEKTLNQNPKP